MKNIKLHFARGQSLIELLVTIGIAAIVFPALIIGLVATRNGKAQENQRTQATALLQQTQEIVRVIRENDWAFIATNGTFYPIASGNVWSLTPGSDTLNGLSRQIVISDVYRTNGAIVSTGGALDPSTKKIVITISWNSPITSSLATTSYFTHFVNEGYRESTFTDFIKGSTQSGTLTITNTDGGEITLGAGNGSGDDWCTPGNSVLATTDLVRNGIPFAISATTSASADQLYVTTGNNASGYVSEVASVDHNNPPTITIGNFYNTGKGYGVYVDHSGGYVYVGETTKTVEILHATTMAHVSYFNAGNNMTGDSVFVLNGIGYVTVSSPNNPKETLYTFRANPINEGGSQSLLGSTTLSYGKGNKIIVVKDPTSGITYAYVAEAASHQLEIFQVSSDGKTITPVANAQIANAQQGQDIFVNTSGNRVYLVTNTYASGQNQFFILNTSTKSGSLPAPVGSFSTYSAARSSGMNPTGIIVVSGNRAIVVGSQVSGLGQQYQVYNISDESTIKYCGGTSTATIPNGIDIRAISSLYRSDQTAYSYFLRSDNKVQVVQGGNGADFTFGGTFESQTFTATTEAAFNSFTTNTAVPSQTTLQFTVAIKHAVNNSCSTVAFANTDFVGTDGTANTYFPSTGGQLPMSNDAIGYENPGRCLRYRAYFSTSDITQSPELYAMSFNYSP